MIFLVVALQSEARPLIDHLGLAGTDSPRPYRLYRSDRVSLVVSGVGRPASAAATAYLFAQAGEVRNQPWINVGIAGHRSLEVGAAALAHKITDAAVARSWYPSLVFDPPVPTRDVVTVDRPETEFATDALYDMEAAAFFATASRFAVVELVHVFKIVSDNLANPARDLDAARVSELVKKQLGAVVELIDRCERLGRGASRSGPDLSLWLEARRLTVSQRRRLEELLDRLSVVEGREPQTGEFEKIVDAKLLLARLEERLRANRAGYQ